MIVARRAASSIPKSVLPGTQPSATAFVPAFRAFALSDDDVEPVVLEVERLPRPLYAVADYGDSFVPEDFACFFQGKLFAGNDLLFYSAEIDLCHSCMNFKS